MHSSKIINLNPVDQKLIDRENQMSFLMLQEVISNKDIKNVLKKAADKIIAHILKPIIDAAQDTSKTSLADFPEHIQRSIKILATQNIDSEILFGGLLKGFKKADDITGSLENIKVLLINYSSVLTTIDDIKIIPEVFKLLKSIADLSFCFFEYFPERLTPRFIATKNGMWLTREELATRIMRSELKDHEEILAGTYGISRENKSDLLPAKMKVGIPSGKSIFAGACMKKRLEIIIEHFDKVIAHANNLKKQIQTSEQNEILKTQLIEFEEKILNPAILQMQEYKIPLDPHSRKSLNDYAKQFKPTFLKLVSNDKDEYSMPIVANVSRSTARTFCCMHYFDVFLKEDGEFDFETAQKFGNTCYAFYAGTGSHTLSEVAEIFNRSTHKVAIDNPEQLPAKIREIKPSSLPYMEDPNVPERLLPTYHLGNPSTFFHTSYSARITKQALTIQEKSELNNFLKMNI